MMLTEIECSSKPEAFLLSDLKEIARILETEWTISDRIRDTAVEIGLGAKKQPVKTGANFLVLLLPAVVFYPLWVGFVACMVPFRFAKESDLYSSDPKAALEASQWFSNSGHAIGYGIELVAVTSFVFGNFLRGAYQRAKGKRIEQILGDYTKMPIKARDFESCCRLIRLL